MSRPCRLSWFRTPAVRLDFVFLAAASLFFGNGAVRAQSPSSVPLFQRSADERPSRRGVVPAPTRETEEKLRQYIDRVVDPEVTLGLAVGRPRILRFKEAPFRIQVGNEQIMNFAVMRPRELLVQGGAVGTTVLNVWFGDPDNPDKQTVLSILVKVAPRP